MAIGALRLPFYRRRFSSVGSDLRINGRPLINGPGIIKAGDNLYINNSPFRTEIYSAEENSSINIGNNVFINHGVLIAAQTKIDIGDFSMIGHRSIITDSDWHGIDRPEPKMMPVTIGKHVLVCMGAQILKGVTIGDNSIIGAGAIVTKDVEEKTIVAGNPARKIGSTKEGYSRS